VIQANASRRPPEELEGLDHLEAEAPGRLADGMMALRDEFRLKVLGGYCGTDDRHIAALADHLMVGGR
jgi:homocysteine S-methyltransferase